MNLQEYQNAVVRGELTEKAIKFKWERVCWEISQSDDDIMSELVDNGFFEQVIEIESDDKFGAVCQELAQLDVSTISELINNGFLEPLIDLEAQDCFGTEGMKL